MTTRVLVRGNPFERAIAILGARLRQRGSEWVLDGRIADGRQVIAAANEVAATKGRPRIAYPGVAEIDRRRPRATSLF